ncbi:putative fungal fucose-specific lectin [Diplodia seriata]|uniref:Putative fungal fucose-specific lectin n=1 Tax=Diplodia seriata TaxID=420778 RepID=A0A0G2FP86_9PEZI|nr:putative fungal fucose-specific lectin [Diplodia seriata]
MMIRRLSRTITGPEMQESQNKANHRRYLSATNYTDPQEKEHSQVYFQDESLDIWMADREAADGSAWSPSQVNTTGTSPKNGTPIAAFNYFPDASVTENNEVESEFGLRYLDAGTNRIRARFVKNRMIGQTWQVAPTPDQSAYRAAANSSLAGYADACGEACVQTNLMAFADADDAETHVAYPYAARYGYDTFPSRGVGADAGTAYALVPVLPLAGQVNDEQPYVAMYLSARGRLREVYFGVEPQPAWNASDMDVDLVVDTGNRIAAMAPRRLDDLRYVQVLATKRDGGVMMAYLDGGPDKPWAATEAVEGMENVVPLSPIAANQVGHVYALEEVDGRREIVEWKMASETGTPTFDRVGVVSPAPTTTAG